MFQRGSLAERPAYAQIVCLLLLIFTGACLSSFLGFVAIKPLFGVDAFNDSQALFNYNSTAAVSALKLIQVLSSIGIFILPVIAYSYLMDADNEGVFSVLKMKSAMSILVAVLIVILMFSISPLIDVMSRWNESMQLPEFMRLIENWMKTQEEQAATITKVFLQMDGLTSLLVNIFMIALIPAIGEELLFRGVFQRLFANWFKNPHVGILIAAFIFSAIHIQFYGFIPRFALGVLLGYLFYWSNNLWLPVLAHFINNGTAVIAMYLSQRGVINYDMDEPIQLPFYMILLSLFISLILLYRIRKSLA